jgi:hypothetical protein
MSPTATLHAEVLARLADVEDLAAEAGLRLALALGRLDAVTLAEAKGDVNAAAECLQALLARLPAEAD